MSLATDLLQTLATAQIDEDTTTLVIDNYLRTIQIPKGITNLGVEYDDEVLLLNFRMPRYLDKTDLSVFKIRINYLNQKGESDVYDVTSPTIGSDYITFSWLVGPTATAYKGKTKFNVCLKECDSEGVVLREYNTTIASLPVLEGLETDPGVVSEYTDILEQWRQQLFGVGVTEEGNIVATSEAEQQKIVDKGIEVLATIPPDYTETYTLAHDSVRTRANAIVQTVADETIAISDSSDDYLRGLKVFGKTRQQMTTGKNLLKATPGAMTNQGGRVTVNADGTIMLSGTFTANASFAIGTFNGNGEFIISSGTTSSAINDSYIYMMLDGESSTGWYGVDVTFSNDGTNRTVNLVVIKGSYNNTVIKPMIRLSSIADSAYEPYSGGFVSPSPSWPQELDSVDSPTVDLYGKNLIQNTLPTATICGITYTRNEDGSITLNGTATDNSYYSFDFNNRIPAHNTEMVLSLKGGAGLTSISLGYFREDGSVHNSIVYAEDNAVNFKYPSDAARTRTFLTVTTGKTCNNLTVYPMVRLADTDDTFEGDKATQSIAVAYNLHGVPVNKNGNYVDADGKQWVCDYIDCERGVHVQRIGIATMENISIADYSLSGTTGRGQLIVAPVLPKDRSVYGTLCNIARINHDAFSAVDGEYYENPANVVLVGAVSDTEEAMREKYADFEYAYVLETPIETPLTAEEIEAFKWYHTNYPNTTVLNDSGANMELKYNADTLMFLRDNQPEPTDEQVQAAVDAWLVKYFSSAEGVSF